MGGWGRKVMLIAPNGEALPCHAAKVIPGLRFENVKEKPLRDIWDQSDAFQRFRGESWMQEPCKSCDRRSQDFGGCRCQAMLLAGDAAATDIRCARFRQIAELSTRFSNPYHPRSSPGQPEFLYRPNPA